MLNILFFFIILICDNEGGGDDDNDQIGSIDVIIGSGNCILNIVDVCQSDLFFFLSWKLYLVRIFVVLYMGFFGVSIVLVICNLLYFENIVFLLLLFILMF